MTFNSLAFLELQGCVLVAFFCLPQRWRWLLLLAASYYFYMYWRPQYALIMLASTSIDYAAALLMERWPQEAARGRRRACLVVSLGANLGLLFAFKYYAFATSTLAAALGFLGSSWQPPAWDVLLPVGISFYTFQSMSYTIDVYRGRCQVERHFGIFALYVAFYPQLVAGPIERSSHLLPQFRRQHVFDADAVREGLRRILWGLFKKTVIADRLAAIVTPVYADPLAHAGLPLWIGTYAFALQIYADFSAYSDIAIGSARLLGFDLRENFRRPYLARDIGEFWQRWHVSLSTWFRDYVYIPLGGNRVGERRWTFNVLAVFLLSGLWHGAAWTFVVWGGLHGLWLLIGKSTRAWRDRLAAHAALPETVHTWASRFVCFHLVCIGWVFFRAGTLTGACQVLAHLFDGWNLAILGQVLPAGVEAWALFGGLLLAGTLEWAEERGWPAWQGIASWPLQARWLSYAAVALMLLNFSVLDDVEFIYFQF